MALSKQIFALFTLFQIHAAFAQWHQLPSVTSYSPNVAWTTGAFGQTAVRPIANGKLFHARFTPYGAHSGQNDLKLSYDDLQNNQCVFCPLVQSSASPGEHVFDICSSGDTTVSFCYANDGLVRFKFSFDGFNTSLNSSLPGGNSVLISQCITYRHLYVAYTFSSQDTLRIIRATGTSPDEPIKLPAYRSSGISDSKPQRLWFVDDSTGYLLATSKANSAKTVIIKTIDYGMTWNEMAVDSINPINACYFGSTSTGYLLKMDGSIHKTSDGGLSWNQLISPSASSLTCINFYDAQNGYVGGDNGALWKTTDGGNSWSVEQGTGSKPILEVWTFANGLAYCVNSDHDVFKNQSDITGLVSINQDLAEVNIYPNPASDELTIDISLWKQGVKNISLTNVLGERVYSSEINNATDLLQIPVYGLQTGSYMIILKSDDWVVRKKMIVSR